MSELDLLQALSGARQELSQLKSRYAVNNAVIVAAPHAHNCRFFKRGAYHQPVVMDTLTGEPRDAMEADCSCWKRELIWIEPDADSISQPAIRSYKSQINIRPEIGDRFDLFLLLCIDFRFSPGMGDPGSGGAEDYCTSTGTDYSDILYRTTALVGEMKLQKFTVIGYRIDGVVMNVRVGEAAGG